MGSYQIAECTFCVVIAFYSQRVFAGVYMYDAKSFLFNKWKYITAFYMTSGAYYKVDNNPGRGALTYGSDGYVRTRRRK